MGEDLWRRAKAKANLKRELKMKVSEILVTERNNEMKSAYENYFKKFI